MNEERPDQTIFRCTLCNKQFHQQSTFKRHGYYCRSRPSDQQIFRGRACLSCAKCKTRCDSKVPQCSRCKLKRLECRYDDPMAQDHRRKSTPVSLDANPTPESPLDLRTRDGMRPSLNYLDALPSSAESGIHVQDILNEGLEFSQSFPGSADSFWDLIPTEIPTDFPLSSPPVSNSTVMPGRYYTQPDTPYSLFFQNSAIMPKISHPVDPYCYPPAFQPRMTIKAASQSSAIMLTRVLHSYPKMMLQRDRLPPFIHPQCYPCGNKDTSRINESLANCTSLVQIFMAGPRESKRLGWRTIRLESQRLLEKWEILAAIQSHLIYILLRIIEGETEDNRSVDGYLLQNTKILRLAMAAEQWNDYQVKDPDNGHERAWREWIYIESRRRTIIVFRIIALLINFPAVLCDPKSGFVLAPLPARKSLWEARDDASWRSDIEWSLNGEKDFGLTQNGNLVRLKQQLTSGNDEDTIESISAKNWEDWCSEMDEFGALIMIGASLL